MARPMSIVMVEIPVDEETATALISSDKDLLALHPWRGVPTVRPSDYVMLR